MKFGVSVIYAVGVLFRSKVTAKNNAHFICIAALYHGRTYGVMLSSLAPAYKFLTLVCEILPRYAYLVTGINDFCLVFATHTNNGSRPIEDAEIEVIKATKSQRNSDFRIVHGEHFASALIVVVSQYASAYSFKRCVATDKIVRKLVNEIKKIYKRLTVNFHGRMLAINRNTVLIEVSVGRELPEPWLPVKN